MEWAVKMRRLTGKTATLEQRMARARINHGADAQRLGRRLAAFHAAAEPQLARIFSFGRYAVVAGNLRENFTVSAPAVGITISRSVRDRLLALTEQALSELQPLIDARAVRGVPCDTRRDLQTSITSICSRISLLQRIW